jgi:single-strand DNA-binding protein
MTAHAHATIAGHLGRDPETRPAGAGTVTTLSVAVTRRAPGADRAKDVTTWWKVSVWSKSGEAAAKFLHKGDPVICDGWPEVEEWQDDQQAKRQTLRLRNASWSFVGSKGDRAEPAPAAAPASTPPATRAPADEEPPF